MIYTERNETRNVNFAPTIESNQQGYIFRRKGTETSVESWDKSLVPTADNQYPPLGERGMQIRFVSTQGRRVCFTARWLQHTRT